MSPQPGLALLHLERSDTDVAAASIRTAVQEVPIQSPRRARLLEAQAEIAASGRDPVTARAAASELVGIAALHASNALKASAASAVGIALLTAGNASAALGQLREACQLWLRVQAPYHAVFDRLGARPDAARAIASIETLGESLPAQDHRSNM